MWTARAAGVAQADVTSFSLPAPADQLPLPEIAASGVPTFFPSRMVK